MFLIIEISGIHFEKSIVISIYLEQKFAYSLNSIEEIRRNFLLPRLLCKKSTETPFIHKKYHIDKLVLCQHYPDIIPDP